jgi:iron complex outermembrane receptor protein
VGAVLAVFENLSLRGLIGRAYRIPTFTDLYYNDAANKGNSNLKPESAWSYEAGADLTGNNLRLSATYFHRDSYDTIDWIRYSTQSAWQASNIGTVDTNGAELYLGADLKSLLKGPILERASLVYNAVDSYAKHDYFSKYQLDYLKQQISAALEFGLFGFKNSWVLNYKKRIGDSGYITVDTRISGTIFKKGKRGLKVFLLITNIFDAAYSEQSNIEMPGRWIKAGGRFEF